MGEVKPLNWDALRWMMQGNAIFTKEGNKHDHPLGFGQNNDAASRLVVAHNSRIDTAEIAYEHLRNPWCDDMSKAPKGCHNPVVIWHDLYPKGLFAYKGNDGDFYHASDSAYVEPQPLYFMTITAPEPK